MGDQTLYVSRLINGYCLTRPLSSRSGCHQKKCLTAGTCCSRQRPRHPCSIALIFSAHIRRLVRFRQSCTPPFSHGFVKVVNNVFPADRAWPLISIGTYPFL